MEPQAILSAAKEISIPTFTMLIMGGAVWGGIKVVGWGSEVTRLLGNHLRHDLAAQTESLSRIENILNEQTLVLRALGRMLMEVQSGKREF